jgi:hypothetical protein
MNENADYKTYNHKTMLKRRTPLEWIEISLAALAIMAAVGYGAYRAVQPAPPDGVACAQKVKQCPDGSYVGRRGPWCEFAPCPNQSPSPAENPNAAEWKTYRNDEYGFKVKYPPYGLTRDFSEHLTDDGFGVRFGVDDFTNPSYDLPERADFYVSISEGTMTSVISDITNSEDKSSVKQQNIRIGSIDFVLLEWTQPDCPPCSPGRFAMFLTSKNGKVYEIGPGYSFGEPGTNESDSLRAEALGALQNILSTFKFIK